MTDEEKQELLQRAKCLAERHGEMRSGGKVMVWTHHELRIFWVPEVDDLRLQTLHGPHDWYTTAANNHRGSRFLSEGLALMFLKKLRELMLLDDLAGV